MNAADRAELAAMRADIAAMRKHLAQFAKVAGIIYDAGWDDAMGRRPSATNSRSVTARPGHLRTVKQGDTS